MQLQSSLLGGIKLLWKGKIISQFATKKVLGLFCFLLENTEADVSRDKLMTLFWGEFPESQARYALWNIRKLFKTKDGEIDPLITSRTACGLNPDFQLSKDTEDFITAIENSKKSEKQEGLFKALNIYKGSFLEGFTLKNLPEWEEWLYQTRETYQGKFLDVCIEAGNYYLTENQPDQSLKIFQRALRCLPDLEPANLGIIQAYADQGRVASALRHYKRYVDLMKKEYKAPPHPEISQFAEILREGSYDGQSDADTDEIELSIEPEETIHEIEEKSDKPQYSNSELHSPTLDVLSSTRFIGRKKELCDFTWILENVEKGLGQVLIISGEMGIGKTRLFREFLAKIPETFFIGVGEAEEFHSTRPLEELIRILEALMVDSRIPKKLLDSLSNIIALSKNLSDDTALRKETLPLKIRTWISDLAKIAPVVIALDDMHWVSEAGLRIFATLSQDVKRLPILLVGMFRTFEIQSEDEISSSLISIARTGRLSRMELSSLNEDEIKKIISSRSENVAGNIKNEDFHKIYDYCSGIPLYAVELAQYLEEGNLDLLGSQLVVGKPDFNTKAISRIVPPFLIKITKHRLSKLNDGIKDILNVLSLLLGQVSFELIIALVDQDSETLEQNLVELENRNFLNHVESKDRIFFVFNHQMVKLAIAHSLSTFQRRNLFKAIIEKTSLMEKKINSDAKAYYHYNSGDPVGAIPFLQESSEKWFEQGDINQGLEYSRISYTIAYERLENNPEEFIKVIHEHTKNLSENKKANSALEIYRNSLDKLKGLKNDDLEKEISDKINEFQNLLSAKEYKEPKKILPLASVTSKRALANNKYIKGDYDEALVLLDEAEVILDDLPDSSPTILEAGMIIQGRAKISQAKGNYSEALQLLSNSMELLLLRGSSAQIAESWRCFGEIYTILGRSNYAKESFTQCRELAERDNNLIELTRCYHKQGVLFRELKEYDQAKQLFDRALNIGSSLPEVSDYLPEIHLDLAKFYLSTNNIYSAERALSKIEQHVFLRPNDAVITETSRLRGIISSKDKS